MGLFDCRRTYPEPAQKTGQELADELAAFQGYFDEAVADRQSTVRSRLAALETEDTLLTSLRNA